jgi:benzoyl-CoA reductase subunit A
MDERADALFSEGAERKSDFFRDLAASAYVAQAEAEVLAEKREKLSLDYLVGLYDKAILEVENSTAAAGDFEAHALRALDRIPNPPTALAAAVARVTETPFEQVGSVGTGYGRARLPFPEGFAPRSSATGSAPTRCSPAPPGPFSISAGRTRRPSRWTTPGS